MYAENILQGKVVCIKNPSISIPLSFPQDPVPRTRSPDPPPPVPAADAPGSRGRVKFAPPAVRQNPLRAALKAWEAAENEPTNLGKLVNPTANGTMNINESKLNGLVVALFGWLILFSWL